MLKKIIKVCMITFMCGAFVSAGSFNQQAEKDRLAMQRYFLEKFSDPLQKSSHYFPYVNPEEIRQEFIYPVKLEDFKHGSAAWHRPTKEQFEEVNEFPPYEIQVDEGEELWNTPFSNGKTYADCFGSPRVLHLYPHFDVQRNEVITLDQAINECRATHGETPFPYKKHGLESIMAYMAKQSRGQTIHVTIPNQAAADAYERGKKDFYKQRGYFLMSCAECHVAGSGQRVRAEKLSPTLGSVTHFPVYRLKQQRILTLQERLSGCWRDTGTEPPKIGSQELKELAYFMYYMNNGLKLNAPDTRK
jgi:L-cysteine S-thiosulfotransferase